MRIRRVSHHTGQPGRCHTGRRTGTPDCCRSVRGSCRPWEAPVAITSHRTRDSLAARTSTPRLEPALRAASGYIYQPLAVPVGRRLARIRRPYGTRRFSWPRAQSVPLRRNRIAVTGPRQRLGGPIRPADCARRSFAHGQHLLFGPAFAMILGTKRQRAHEMSTTEIPAIRPRHHHP